MVECNFAIIDGFSIGARSDAGIKVSSLNGTEALMCYMGLRISECRVGENYTARSLRHLVLPLGLPTGDREPEVAHDFVEALDFQKAWMASIQPSLGDGV